MKKLIAGLLATAVVSFAAFADEKEGLSVNGYIRAGITDTTDDSVFTSDTWMSGDYFGGGSRIRVNADYTKNAGGITFRYQMDKDFTKWNDLKNLKWAMGYVNFADSQVIAEAGYLSDRFTKTGGLENTGFKYGKGVRLVFAPKAVAGLTLAAQATDYYAETYAETEEESKKGKLKFNKNLFGFSAKYENDAFFVTGGAAVKGYYYGSVGLKAVENLEFVVEAFCDKTADSKDKDNTMICTWAEYTGVENLTLGLLVYTYIADDKWFAGEDGDAFLKVTPAVAYDITDLIQVSAESTVYIPKSWDEDKYGKKADVYATISPAVTFKASPKATATVSGLISTDDKQTPHAFTAGVRYNF